MGRIRDLFTRLGIHSPKGGAATNAKGGKPAMKADASPLEAKRKAAREHMRKLRARRKAEGRPAAELERQRAYNRKYMRKWRAK